MNKSIASVLTGCTKTVTKSATGVGPNQYGTFNPLENLSYIDVLSMGRRYGTCVLPGNTFGDLINERLNKQWLREVCNHPSNPLFLTQPYRVTLEDETDLRYVVYHNGPAWDTLIEPLLIPLGIKEVPPVHVDPIPIPPPLPIEPPTPIPPPVEPPVAVVEPVTSQAYVDLEYLRLTSEVWESLHGPLTLWGPGRKARAERQANAVNRLFDYIASLKGVVKK